MRGRLALALAALAALASAQETSPRIEGPLTLAAAVRAARANSPLVAAAREEALAAREDVRAARARSAPQASLNGFLASSGPGTIFQGATTPQMIMQIPPGQTAIGNVMLMVPIFTGGVLAAPVRVASAGERIALGDLAETTGTTGLSVAEAYLAVLLAREDALREETRIAAAEELVRTTRARLEAGKEIAASVQRAEAELAAARRALVAAHNEGEKALLDLKAAMGVALDSPIEVPDRLALDPVPGTLDDYLRAGRAGRGSLLAERARAEAAEAEIGGAEGALRPQVYGMAMADAATDTGRLGPSVGIVASLPIFDSGGRRAEVRRARALRDRARGLLRQAELNVGKEIRQAWLDLETARANVLSAQASVVSAEAAYAVVKIRVEAGKGLLLEALDALETLVRARADLARALYDHALARARLERAAGLDPGGTPDDVSSPSTPKSRSMIPGPLKPGSASPLPTESKGDLP